MLAVRSFAICSLLSALYLANARYVPSVRLDAATVAGIVDGDVHKFLGIPYALPPVGYNRFRPPKAIPAYLKDWNATNYGHYCVQQATSALPDLPGNVSVNLNSVFTPVPLEDQSEDCLTLNVVKPAGATSIDRYPVVVWIHAGGFQTGGSKKFDAFSKKFVQRSVELGNPVIWVSMNYRLSAYGFLTSSEVKAEGASNSGLLDQRLSLRFVKRYIKKFGGDPGKVLLWGQSAGAVSISMQMVGLSGNTEDLFHGVFLQSGGTAPFGDYRIGQKYYDFVVDQTGCSKAKYTLNCLRKVSLDKLRLAVNSAPNLLSYGSLVLPWVPRSDGGFLKDHPQRMAKNGQIARVPLVAGNSADEGTIFSFTTGNITTDADFRTYMTSTWFPSASASELAPLWSNYPSDPTVGSPFNTGELYAWTAEYKRLAAFQGDFVFQAPRRYLMKWLVGRQKVWGYASEVSKSIPYLGSYHGADIANGGTLNDYVIRFAHTHNPNNGTGPVWPEYTANSSLLYAIANTSTKPTITKDDYRYEPMRYLTELGLNHPV